MKPNPFACLLLTTALVLAWGTTAMAELTLPEIFADHMVLQRGMPVPVWGSAAPGAKVTVTFAGQTKTTTVAADGKWNVTLDPMAASAAPATLTVRAGNRQSAIGNLQFANVLVGEVWLFSGQSNAAMAVRGCESAKEAVAGADLPGIRFFTASPGRADRAVWTVSSPETAGNFSAFAFFFARALHRDENIPVGMIVCARGGTMIQSWISREGLAAHPELKRDVLDSWEREATPARLAELCSGKWRHALKQAKGDTDAAVDKVLNCAASQPAINFERSGMPGMVLFALRGFGWYQGESNAWGFHIADRYRAELKLLIEDWRRLWGGTDRPFLIVQLPQYPQDTVPASPAQIAPWDVVMEAQWRIQDVLPEVYTAVAVDLGKKNDIHPTRKAPVGERLALLARANVYGQEVAARGPVFMKARFNGNRVHLQFAPGSGGLEARGGTLQGFTLAGRDRHFVWADAAIDGDEVVCRSDGIPEPAAVRYAMTEKTGFTLYDAAGLPAAPFRTDDWPADTPPQGKREAVAHRAVSDWRAAKPVTGLTLFHSYRPAQAQTEATFAWDDADLHVRFRCLQDTASVRAEASGSDNGAIWSDDNVQVFLDVNWDRRTYFRVAVNPTGTVADGSGFNDWDATGRLVHQETLTCHRDYNAGWNSGCTATTGRDADAWWAELVIPWASLGLESAPKPGTTMGLQITRTRAAGDERSEWATTGRDYNTGAMMPYPYMKGQRLHHGVGRFGTLTFE